jgi:COP9 signalosome complex subunit 2
MCDFTDDKKRMKRIYP